MSESESQDGSRTPGRGWETADKVAHGAGKAVTGLAWAMVKGYAVLLCIVGVFLMAQGGSGIWIGLLALGYGIYLITPGSKTVVW